MKEDLENLIYKSNTKVNYSRMEYLFEEDYFVEKEIIALDARDVYRCSQARRGLRISLKLSNFLYNFTLHFLCCSSPFPHSRSLTVHLLSVFSISTNLHWSWLTRRRKSCLRHNCEQAYRNCVCLNLSPGVSAILVWISFTKKICGEKKQINKAI